MIILAIPDTHFPWTDWYALNDIAKYKLSLERRKKQPVRVVQLGDITDQKSWSRWSKDPDDPCPHSEWEQVEIAMAKMYELFPEMDILLGNHDTRTIKKAFEAGLPKHVINGLNDLFDYDGWGWHICSKPLVIEGVAYLHGDEDKTSHLASKASHYGMSVVQGHTHKGSLKFLNFFDRELFVMECGAIVDCTSLAFRYAAKSPVRTFKGFGVITNGTQPELISLSRYGAKHGNNSRTQKAV